MEMSTKVSGMKIKLTVLVSILMQMVQFTRENGSMINNMVKESNIGLMGLTMKVYLLMEVKKVRAIYSLRMVQSMKENSAKMRSMGTVFINGVMENNILGSGLLIE